MIAKISNNEFELLRRYIEEQCGIKLNDGKEYLIESRLAKLVAETNSQNFSEFYLKITANNMPNLRDKIVDAMTTNETLWFRDQTPYYVLQHKVLPDLMKQLASGQRMNVRIWSAGCSTGQEPYSIAMLVMRLCETGLYGNISPNQFEILGTDISPTALLFAVTGRYDKLAMTRGMVEEYQNRFFEQNNQVWVIDESVKRLIKFKRFNLQNSFGNLGSFDIIFCRNVAIYFSDEFKRNLFRKIARQLNPGGYFFIGSAESLAGYSEEFTMQEHNKGIYYQVRK